MATSIDLDADVQFNELDPELKLLDEVEDLCGSLVQILPGDRIELVHSTARLYLYPTPHIYVC